MNENTINDGGKAFPQAERIGDAACQYGGMTLRQYAAIKLRVPNSGVDWLDEMIRESLSNELQDNLSDPNSPMLIAVAAD